jgi:toxin ParE1/3/4
MRSYKLSNDAKQDLARIYWRGVEAFGETKADQYYQGLIQRLDEITESPYHYQLVDHIREEYRRSVCGVDSIYYRLNGDTILIQKSLS